MKARTPAMNIGSEYIGTSTSRALSLHTQRGSNAHTANLILFTLSLKLKLCRVNVTISSMIFKVQGDSKETSYSKKIKVQFRTGVGKLFTRRARFGKTVEAAGRTLIGKQGADLFLSPFFFFLEITVHVRI